MQPTHSHPFLSKLLPVSHYYRYIVIITLFLTPLLALTPLQADEANTEKTKITPHIAAMLDEIAAGKAILVDVREQDEWDAGHLTLASFVPLSKLKKGHKPNLGDPSKRVYIHCRSGNRVNVAKPLLRKKGFKDVVALKEGFIQLRDMGLKQAPTSPKE